MRSGDALRLEGGVGCVARLTRLMVWIMCARKASRIRRGDADGYNPKWGIPDGNCPTLLQLYTQDVVVQTVRVRRSACPRCVSLLGDVLAGEPDWQDEDGTDRPNGLNKVEWFAGRWRNEQRSGL